MQAAQNPRDRLLIFSLPIERVRVARPKVRRRACWKFAGPRPAEDLRRATPVRWNRRTSIAADPAADKGLQRILAKRGCRHAGECHAAISVTRGQKTDSSRR